MRRISQYMYIANNYYKGYYHIFFSLVDYLSVEPRHR